MRVGPLLLLEQMRRKDGSSFAFLLLALHYRTALAPRLELTWQRPPRLMSFSAGGGRARDTDGWCAGLWLRLPVVGHFRFHLAPRLSLNSPRSTET